MIDREKVIKELTNLPTTIYDGLYQLRITHDLRDETVKLLKEQEADIIAMSRFLESHGWDSDSICGKNVEIVVTNGDDDDA